MADVVDEAFEAMRKLAPERRDELASFVLRLAADDDDPSRAWNRPDGQFATSEQIEVAFRRFEA